MQDKKFEKRKKLKRRKNPPAALHRRVSSEVIRLDTREQYPELHSASGHYAELAARHHEMLTSASSAVSQLLQLHILLSIIVSLTCCQYLHLAVRFVEPSAQNTLS